MSNMYWHLGDWASLQWATAYKNFDPLSK